jgi:hypothetical protein
METTPRLDDRIALPDGRWLVYAEFGDPDGRLVRREMHFLDLAQVERSRRRSVRRTAS